MKFISRCFVIMSVLEFIHKARKYIWMRLLGPIILRCYGVHFGDATRVIGFPIISMDKGAQITIGSRVSLYSSSRYTPLGVVRPCVLRCLRPSAIIEIGDNVGISGSVICAAERVVIEKNVNVGSGAMIFDTDFHPLELKERLAQQRDVDVAKCAPVVIESGAFIGANVIICKGVRVGREAVVGAGAVVVKDVPAYAVVAGNPARQVASLAGRQ